MRREALKDPNLIHGKYSRKILSAIINDEEIKESDLLYGIKIEQINDLRRAYRQKKVDLQLQTINPRYLPFYQLIKDRLPSFTWNFAKSSNIYIQAPRKNNTRPSLLSLLLGRVKEEDDTVLHRRYQCINSLLAYR